MADRYDDDYRYRREDRYGRGADRDRTVEGSGYAGRNWAERAGDEVASWAGDRDAEARREMDRQRIGRYPGEDRGERLGSGYSSRSGYGRSSNDDYGYSRSSSRDRTVEGSGYAGRNWAERAGDEAASWVGDRDAEARREMDRQRIGRYPGEDRGERLGSGYGSRQGYGISSGNGSSSGYGSSAYDRDRTVEGSGYAGRNWAERAGDEVSSWVGDRDAEARREMDRERIGRYPGEERGERLGGRSGYDNRYSSDRDGYRSTTSYGSGSYGSGSYGSGSYGQSGQSGQSSQSSQSGQSSYGAQGGYGSGSYASGSNYDPAYPGGSAGGFGQSGMSGSGYTAATGSTSYYGGTGGQSSQGAYGSQDQSGDRGYNSDDRGFFSRAADEVASWFGDRDAERRREMDQARDGAQDAGSRGGGDTSSTAFAAATGFSTTQDRYAHDPDYQAYRASRIAEYDRDYSDYRQSRAQEFGQDFQSFRSSRGVASQLREKQKVKSSDGEIIGVIDRVEGSDIKLTRKDSTDGKHHLIPVSWATSVEGDTVTLSKRRAETEAGWRVADQDSHGASGSTTAGSTGTSGSATSSLNA